MITLRRTLTLVLIVAAALAVVLPATASARSDRNWRGVVSEGKGLWWDQLGYGCHLYSFQRMPGNRVLDGRLARWFHTVNPFTGQCQRRVGPVQATTAYWNVRRGVLQMGFVLTGRVRVETVRLVSYSKRSDVLTVVRDGVRVAWYGCLSRYNPYSC